MGILVIRGLAYEKRCKGALDFASSIHQGGQGIDGGGATYLFLKHKPEFIPSGESESLDGWVEGSIHLSSLDNLPLSMVCPSLTSKEALFYTDGETVWLVETK